MNIEELVKKHTRMYLSAVRDVEHTLRYALTELSETHAIEVRDYKATVQNLEQRIRELEAQRVPEGFVVVPVELLQLIQCDVENSADWLSSATSALRNLLSAAPEPKK